MGHKVYISFKTEDAAYKDAIQAMPHLDYVDKSLNEPINSQDPDYVLSRIRADYLNDSTVTIFLIGSYSAENLGAAEQYYIKKELQASLYNSAQSTKNGILGVVLPSAEEAIYGGTYTCVTCGGSHNLVRVNDSTCIREFSYNYYIPNSKCSHAEEDRYCVLVRWADFAKEPNLWIEKAFDKRTEPISSKTKVRP
ncbi:TIR domain-containing protein [Microbacterium sp. VKM Ac-2870]|uniref:TIR domain-containing protein n=1 Tax=Microbacterium sp. VKM Ac-2870 TaxID=2783825 RepID=UPI00188CB0B1|nr:TIR domain-containing protein [Microbacterium sp. VKM Ac-2870]MBF4563119.1 TIR domain-containing protein [Microbacterium sp. VKM Ac-2870]